MNKKRVLVISHNPFSLKQNNGKTLSLFFKGWDKNKIAQFFITPQKIDDEICNNFFYIGDIDLLHFNKKSIGTLLDKKEIKKINEENTNSDSKLLFILKFPLLFKILRETVWKCNFKKIIKSLKVWLDKFKPEAIFFQTSNCIFMYKIVTKISKEYNIPIIMETTDDYITPIISVNLLNYIYTKKLEKEYKKMVQKAYCIFAIGKKMAKEYKERFGGNYKVAMNAIEISDKKTAKKESNDIVMSYTGNLSLNRWKVLYDIASSLEKINSEYSKKCILNIYSLEKPTKKMKSLLFNLKCCKYMGSANQNQIKNIQKASDIVIHVESFDKKMRKITRLSISTKIPEYLASKTCIFAVGPSDVASIEHLKNNKLAVIVDSTKKNDIYIKLKEIIFNKKLRERISEKAFIYAHQNHNAAKINDMINETIMKSTISEKSEIK